MSLIDRIFNRSPARNEAALYGEGAEELMQWLGIAGSSKEEIAEVTYFTCLKKLSEAIGKIPLKYYQETRAGKQKAPQTDVSRLLTFRPNPYMTPATLWATTEFACQHHGNGYIWMQKERIPDGFGGNERIVALYPMSPECVSIIMDDAGIFGGKGKLYYRYSDPKSGETYMFQQETVLHFKTWFSKDGILGESVRSVLKETVGGAAEQQEVMNTLYKQGVTASMVLEYSTDLDEKRVKALKKKFGDQLTTPKNAGKIVPIPQGLTLKPINMSLADSQFSELRKYSALQIAAAFGIKPNQINDYTKSSYSNSEMQQLDFLVDTLMSRITMYEQEINAKVLTRQEMVENKYYKFNERAILRADTQTQMEALAKGVNNFIYKPNEARDYLDLPTAEGGDELIGNGNYIKLTMVGEQYSQGGGNNGKD